MYRIKKQTKRDVLKRFREKMSYRRKVRTSIRRVSIRFENQQREDELNDKYFLINSKQLRESFRKMRVFSHPLDGCEQRTISIREWIS